MGRGTHTEVGKSTTIHRRKKNNKTKLQSCAENDNCSLFHIIALLFHTFRVSWGDAIDAHVECWYGENVFLATLLVEIEKQQTTTTTTTGSPINVIKNAHTHEWVDKLLSIAWNVFCDAVVVPLPLEGLMGAQYVLTNGMDGMPAFSGVCVCLWVMKRESITKWMPLTGGLLGNLDYPAAKGIGEEKSEPIDMW